MSFVNRGESSATTGLALWPPDSAPRTPTGRTAAALPWRKMANAVRNKLCRGQRRCIVWEDKHDAATQTRNRRPEGEDPTARRTDQLPVPVTLAAHMCNRRCARGKLIREVEPAARACLEALADAGNRDRCGDAGEWRFRWKFTYYLCAAGPRHVRQTRYWALVTNQFRVRSPSSSTCLWAESDKLALRCRPWALRGRRFSRRREHGSHRRNPGKGMGE
ncbi:hypothetical protein BV25DRAFT_1165133 [Artomyces pyxidatus]|uniref:Uncharacterized protein n=1 Tax=Artomyces pyxidatus TaxID=48021 RepID=A0ACB8SRC7_9AGAM|nr:hypothetical protein BV25DRAFT_1165133 [Artomyces pyxidatus]